jgi:hypothetical protein
VQLRDFLPRRSVEDILSGRIRFWLGAEGGRWYEVPVLPIEANERWRAGLDAQLASLLTQVTQAGDDAGLILGLLTGASNDLLGTLVSYDEGHTLPPQEELARLARPHEALRAVLECWLAANPLAAIGLLMADEGNMQPPAPTTSGAPSAPTKPPAPTGGAARATSGAH